MPFSNSFHERFVEQAKWTVEARKLFLQSIDVLSESTILEVGCGTGAVLESFKIENNLNLFGLDISRDLMKFAQKNSSNICFTNSNAYQIPFPDNNFEIVFCHYFLLWIKQPEVVLKEFLRVTRPGGYIAIFAEPDYSHSIIHPNHLAIFGEYQRQALINQGANPDVGLQIGGLMKNIGCINISTGLLGSFQSNIFDEQMQSETMILKSDLTEIGKKAEFELFIKETQIARLNNSLVHYIPTFFGWGQKPFSQ